MALVYSHKSDVIGPFADTGYLVSLLERTFDVEERDRLVCLLAQLVNEPKNVKALLDADGVKCLVDLLPLAHFHTQRAVLVTQSNVIEAGADMTREMADKEKEWYFSNSAQERLGPFSLNEMKEMFKKVSLFRILCHTLRCLATLWAILDRRLIDPSSRSLLAFFSKESPKMFCWERDLFIPFDSEVLFGIL